ncbi:hypothetical protein JHK85_013995 [Glycine max]|nr:hypothetical protein JHK85_013995 [Glycine max]KHM99914.1 hypothetical protein glysoja_017612 [Glycine soja]
MRLEKEKTEELENRGREQEKLQTELKQLKDFKPTMLLNLPVLKDNKQKKDKKKRPSPPYIL